MPRTHPTCCLYLLNCPMLSMPPHSHGLHTVEDLHQDLQQKISCNNHSLSCQRQIGMVYICRDGILEYYWGEHIHLGYYTEEERARGYKKKDFKQAKFDFVDEMLRWSGATSPSRVLDVGCGIGGTSRHLAAKFPGAQVQGKPWPCHCCTLLHALKYHAEERVRWKIVQDCKG